MSHLTVPDDLAGAMAILDWLAFVPKVSVVWKLTVTLDVEIAGGWSNNKI